MQRLPLGLVLLALTTLAGCGRYYDIGNPHGARGEFAMIVPGGRYRPPRLWCPSCRTRERTTVYSTVYYVNGSAPATMRASKRDAVKDEPELPMFDPQAARTALSKVDVSMCREAGAPTGFGHARVTINPDGHVSKVVIDEPPGMPRAAVDCVGHRLGAATVAPFKGSLVTVGTTYHVH